MASTDKMNKITENILLNGSKSLKIFKLVVVLFVSEYLWPPLVSPPANALSPASVGRGNGSVVSPPTAGGRGSGILSPPSSGRGALSPPSLHSSSLSPGTPHTLQVGCHCSLEVYFWRCPPFSSRNWSRIISRTWNMPWKWIYLCNF